MTMGRLRLGAGVSLALAALVAGAAGASTSAAAAGGRDGEIVFRSDRDDGQPDLYLMKRDGSGVRRLTYLRTRTRAPAWSRDGRTIAFAAEVGGDFDVYTVRADGSGLRRVTTSLGRDDDPRWTADGRLVFTRGPLECPCEIWITNADGTGQARLRTGPGNARMADASRTGARLVFASDRDGQWELYTMQLAGSALRKRTSVAGSPGGDFRPRWSPTGSKIAFLRDDGLDNDLYVMHASGQGLRRLTETQNRAEEHASWSPSGEEIVFMRFGGGEAGRLHSIRPDGTNDVQLSTAYSAPFVDTFDDGYRDGSLWHAIEDPGGSILETGGRLVATIEADAVPGGIFNQVDEHWGSQCSLAGDFDYQVDYELLEWPPHGGFYAALSAFFASGAVARKTGQWDPPFNDQYVAWNEGGFASLNTADLAGSFRLARVDSTLTALYRTAGTGAWTTFLSGPAPGETVFGMGLSTPAAEFNHQLGRVAFDDFRLNSGTLSCPSWWSDGFPDWGAARR
jgi:dipeptidyl aminopeptidase/acylaminoacyl peptidase